MNKSNSILTDNMTTIGDADVVEKFLKNINNLRAHVMMRDENMM